MKKITGIYLGLCVFLSACSGVAAADAPTPATSTPPSPAETATSTQAAPTAEFIPPTEAWIVQGPDSVTVPIILYHRIDISPINSRYYVPPEKFDAQLKLLRDWGYTTISTQMLVDALHQGAALPPRPIIITFDDGNLDNYKNAFPIMEKYGFTGVLYLVARYMGAEGYMTIDQTREMIAAGWEVGSHSMTHADLTFGGPESLRHEIVDSRTVLEEALDAPVLTIAYPFGLSNSSIMDYAHFAGYIGGMGLGPLPKQDARHLYSLQRREILGDYDVLAFASFLPWQGNPAYLPTLTATPTFTPTRTPIPTYTKYPTSTTAP